MAELEAFPEDWQRALCVVAHPDDMEYGAAGAVARWTAAGKTVVYVMVSSGEAGIDGIAPEEAGPLREREQLASAHVVGVDTVDFLGYPDGVIEYGVPLRRGIAAVIRKYRPELVVTNNYHDRFSFGGRNMSDHRNVGNAVLDAVRDAANRWVFRDLDAAAWRGTRYIAAPGSPLSSHAVDITDTIDLAVASLREHRAYLEGLGGAMADPDEFLRGGARTTAERFGGKLATSFELITL